MYKTVKTQTNLPVKICHLNYIHIVAMYLVNTSNPSLLHMQASKEKEGSIIRLHSLEANLNLL